MDSLKTLRRHFPALARTQNGRPVAYFDGPAGTQVPQCVIDAISSYLSHHNANCGAAFATSRESDAELTAAREAASDLLGTGDSDTIAFGPNMTTLTFLVSRALAQTWRAGDEVIVSRLDHDANVSPWVQAAKDAGGNVKYIDIHPEDCTLDMESFRAALSNRTKLVAVGFASNCVGTINPVREFVRAAHEVGALMFIDAVHYAPHGPIDVEELDCDFLVCSAYKFFGPHVGILYGKRDLLESLKPSKLRPSPTTLPGKWLIGTQNHEGIAGVRAAVDYLADVGRQIAPAAGTRRERLLSAFDAIGDHECNMAKTLLAGLASFPAVKIWGITDAERLSERVPTVSITHERLTPRKIATQLAECGLFVWDGNHYALPLTEALGLEPHGTLRVGLVHYNTNEEVERLIEELERIV